MAALSCPTGTSDICAELTRSATADLTEKLRKPYLEFWGVFFLKGGLLIRQPVCDLALTHHSLGGSSSASVSPAAGCSPHDSFRFSCPLAIVF